jgi:hypothetical protein
MLKLCTKREENLHILITQMKNMSGSETFGAFDEMFTEYLLMLTLE